MEFQAAGKKCSRLGFWNKCIVQIVNNTITFSKPKSKKNINTILVSKNTLISLEKNDGRNKIIIKDNAITVKFVPKINFKECFIALKSTKFANTRLHLDDFLVMAKIGQGSFALQNATDFFIGLEYAPGGDMRRLLDKYKRISIPDIRIYLSEIAICLNSLQNQKIIYRDLKPENILITSSGHIKLTDLGLSKDISCISSTSTFCGTLCYMAPEVISHHSYSYEADWYQLGIVAYEFAFGKVPFFDENRKKIMEKIISEKAIFPDNSDPNLVDLIKCLLEKDPKKRMNYERFQNHSFFMVSHLMM